MPITTFPTPAITPARSRSAPVTPDMNKAFLISECNGHMFPHEAL